MTLDIKKWWKGLTSKKIVVFLWYVEGGLWVTGFIMEFGGLVSILINGADKVFMAYSGLLSLISAFGTVAAAACTLYTARVALSLANKDRDNEWFERNFSLLLEQHNEQLSSLVNHPKFKERMLDILCEQNNYPKLSDINKKLHDLDYFFGGYLRVLYQLLKHVDEHYPRKDELREKRKFYTSIIRSFLNSEITTLLAINSAHAKKDNQYYKYKKLIENYSLLEHLIISGEKFCEAYQGGLTYGFATQELFSHEGNDSISGLKFLDEICIFYNIKAFDKSEWIDIVKKVKGIS